MEETVLKKIIFELSANQEFINNNELYRLADMIISGKRIFTAGAGRSGYIVRGFANRLMHLGFPVHVVGEPTTPSVGEGDLLVIISGSGRTASLVTMASKAKDLNAELAVITIFPEGAIGKSADLTVCVPGETPKNEAASKYSSFQPMGNLFEQFSWLICDSVIIILKEKLGVTDTQMFDRHANLE